MEIRKVCLQRQQMILKFLGYYQGKCDGIWSAMTIEAKRNFENSGKFHPAYPNNGMPFDPTSKFPSGIMLDFSKPRTGLLIHVDIPEEYYQKFATELVEYDETVDLNESKIPTYDPLLNQTMQLGVESTALAIPQPVLLKTEDKELPAISEEVVENKQEIEVRQIPVSQNRPKLPR
jgi:hypothetical protein